MTDFAATLRASILADPVESQSLRGRHILRILDAADSPWRARHLERWESAVRKHYALGADAAIDWTQFWVLMGHLATVLSIIIMLIGFLGTEEGEAMATPAQELELKTKLTALVMDHYGGDWQKLFDTHSNAGLMDERQLVGLLRNAGVGNVFTVSAWAYGIIDALDADHDGLLTLAEIRAAAG